MPAESLVALRLMTSGADSQLAERITFLPQFRGALAIEPVSASHLTVEAASGNEVPTGPTSHYVVQSRSPGASDVWPVLVRSKDDWVLFSAQVNRVGETAVVRPIQPPRVIGRGKGVKGYRVTLTARSDQISFSDSTEIVLPKGKLVFLDSMVSSHPEGLFIRRVELMPLRAAPDGGINARLSDGSQILGNLCASECPWTQISVERLARNAFVEADSDDEVTVRSVSDEQRAWWRVDNVRRGVAFTVTRPGWRFITHVPGSSAFINAKGLWELIIIALLGGFLTLGWILVVGKWVLAWLRSHGGPRSAPV